MSSFKVSNVIFPLALLGAYDIWRTGVGVMFGDPIVAHKTQLAFEEDKKREAVGELCNARGGRGGAERALPLGFGRVVVLDIEAPSLSVNLVWSG